MLTAATRLEARDLDAVADLERRVVAVDGGRLKLEWGVLRSRDGERVNDLLWWHGDRLAGFCGIYAFGTDVELAGMVDPAVRRRGIGSALLAAALPHAAERGADRVLLVTPRSSAAGREFARARGGTLDHSEHFMVLGATPTPSTRHADVVIRDATPGDEPHLRRVLTATFGADDEDGDVSVTAEPNTRTLAVERDGEVIGSLRLVRTDATTGIYGFAVDPALQGQGIGRTVLARVCAALRSSGVREVTLEVGVDNDHALDLYTSSGFERRTTEDYYAVRTAVPTDRT